jgi:polar amino acid transport system substrate-binding protein/arginine/ornithine transport system substrate-binding protein
VLKFSVHRRSPPEEIPMLKKLALAAVALAAFMVQADAQQARLRVGVEGNYPPFSQISPSGQISGFDIDIANAVCAELKMECQLVQQEFDGMIPALAARRFDIIVASLTITPARLERVDFSAPYYDVPSQFVARNGAFQSHSPDALRGKRIIVLRNSPRAAWLQQNYPQNELHLANRETDVYLELVAGRGDIAFGSSVVSTEQFLKRPEGAGYGRVGEPVRLQGGTGGVGIAVRKGDTETLAKVNQALAAIRSNGVYRQIMARYFDYDISPSN